MLSQEVLPVNMKTHAILKKVRTDYTLIAKEFDKARDREWPEFSLFLKYLKRQNKKKEIIRLLDLGCGNGRLAQFLKTESIDYTGVDNNRSLLAIAKKKNPRSLFRYADILKLPFPADLFDTVWCIAVLHHIPTKKLQLKALKEIKRVLKKNGTLMITVWNLWQARYKNFIDKETQNALIAWKRLKKGETIQRYYYAFQEKELRALLKKSGFSRLKKVVIKSEQPHYQRNIAFIAAL